MLTDNRKHLMRDRFKPIVLQLLTAGGYSFERSPLSKEYRWLENSDIGFNFGEDYYSAPDIMLFEKGTEIAHIDPFCLDTEIINFYRLLKQFLKD